jgi:hypothetical protein
VLLFLLLISISVVQADEGEFLASFFHFPLDFLFYYFLFPRGFGEGEAVAVSIRATMASKFLISIINIPVFIFLSS